MNRGDGSAGHRAGALPRTRPRWFTGRFLTARDLTDEQEYHRGRRHLHNRLLHGWGVVCGLRVRPDDRAGQAHEYVRVEPGIALDARGREIVLDELERVRWPADPSLPYAGHTLGVLCIRYDECLAEPLPAIAGDCGAPNTTEPGRIVEKHRFEVHVPTGEPGDPWSELLYGSSGDASTDGDGEPGCGPDGGCVEPADDLDGCVPIALLCRTGKEPIRVDVDGEGVVRTVRRSLPPPAAWLTHVSQTSWEHGSYVPVDELIRDHGRLHVWFDREIAEGDETRVGVNSFTFVVEVEDPRGNRERLAADPRYPPVLVGEREAVFTIDPDELQARRKGGHPGIVGETVFVTVYGDLIHDCHGLPVDADYLGSFPSGNGVKGGVFRSWFTVSPEASQEADK
ncbi:hypothetical protein ACQP2E_12275 [Actinoplanes sp. CA-015351]|uniref:hypothetical protein n=1 Tax=Actinoplanes sp. CA-015351 TaxID=3239897 RepID=UPI003D955932